MQLCHAAAAVDIVFDDPNLIGDGGLVQVIGLAERVGLPGLVADRVKINDAANSGGANPAVKVMSLLAGMVLARTASTMWTGSGLAGWTGCSPG